MSQCKKFAPNIFHKTKCSNCFRQKEEHSAEALECNRASRSIARSGYLFVAPDWDFSVPLNRTKVSTEDGNLVAEIRIQILHFYFVVKDVCFCILFKIWSHDLHPLLDPIQRWQRRWFVLFDDGELNYSVDEHPDTVPQGCIDMSKVLEVTGAEQITGHPHSLALTGPDRVTFVKAASREDARWWAELLAVFPRRHKRNATFPGGRASPSLPQLGRSASPQPPRPRHLSCTGPSPRTNFTTPPLKEERETPTTAAPTGTPATIRSRKEALRPVWIPEPTNNRPIETPPPQRTDYVVTSGSPPTRDKLRQEDKDRARKDWRHERLRDIATALTDHSPESSLLLPAEGLLNLKKGWLWYKEKNVESEWLKRWWVLCEQTLNAYLEQDEQSIPEITIELSNVVGISEATTDTRYSFQIQSNGPTYILSAVTSGIRSNWLQALKKASPVTEESPPIAPTPRSNLLSSDEEYRTASEGGRRDSEDWGELPPSPPLSRTMLAKVKERTRLRTKLPRSQSRQSTLDSVSTDELDACKPPEEVEIKNTINKQTVEIDGLRKQLSSTHSDMHYLETELTRFKKLQSESLVREKQAKEMIQNLERSELDLSQKVKQMEEKYSRDQKTFHCRLIETEQAAERTEEKYLSTTRELQVKLKVISSMQQELDCLNERYTKSRQENDRLYKKIQELECKPHRRKRLDSLTDLMDINMDVDFNNLGHAELIEQYLDLRARFEKAVIEIKAMKRELRESHVKNDQLELETIGLRKSLEMAEQEAMAQSALMADRVQDLTVKLATAEKQARSLKLKLQDSREKRRSLSLKGRENFSISKEIEDKITELETKIFALERNRSRRKHRRDRSSERSSPIDDKSLRRLRRKSLDSATSSSSEPIKLFMRLNNLEGKIANAITTSNESLNTTTTTSAMTANTLTAKTDEVTNSGSTNEDRSLCVENVILAAIEKLSDCKFAFNLLKTNANCRDDDELNILENYLGELACILNSSKISDTEFNVIRTSAGSVVKQLENILKEKLNELYERKRRLAEANQLNDKIKIELLAEKLAYENIIVHRIHQALNAPTFSDSSGNNCQRLVHKEALETINLLYSINGKLYGTVRKDMPEFKTSVEYLTKVLTKRLLSAAHGFNLRKSIKNNYNIPALLNYLEAEQAKMNSLLSSYKSNKLLLLAEALAFKTINLENDSNVINLKSLERDIVEEMFKVAKENVNSELIESEIHHIMMRTAQLYEEKSSAEQNFFFTFFAYERASLELWSDSVETQLHAEMDRNIDELTDLFRQSLSKMQKQNWRRRLDLADQLNVNIDTLLGEFADIISHKSLIDSRIIVLKSEYKSLNSTSSDSRNNINHNDSAVLAHLIDERCTDSTERANLMDLSQGLEAEFKCMLDHYSMECENSITMKIDLIEIQNSLQDLALEIYDIVSYCTGRDVENLAQISSLNDVCERCEQLRKQLGDVKKVLVHLKNSKRSEDDEEKRPLYLGTEYLNQVEHLRAAYRRTLTECESRRQQADLEQLQVLCEQVLVAMEHWHRRTLQDLREQHTRELHALQKDKEQALAEETQATLAALDAMRKAHEAEVQREIARFKQDFARRQQDELLELTERLSVKCLEAAALEEQLGSATRQLAHAQQHILQLERNPQLSMQN